MKYGAGRPVGQKVRSWGAHFRVPKFEIIAAFSFSFLSIPASRFSPRVRTSLVYIEMFENLMSTLLHRLRLCCISYTRFVYSQTSSDSYFIIIRPLKVKFFYLVNENNRVNAFSSHTAKFFLHFRARRKSRNDGVEGSLKNCIDII